MVDRGAGKLFAVCIAGLLLFAGLSGCAIVKGDRESRDLLKLSPGAYPDFFDDMDFDGLEHGLEQSLSYLKRIPPTRKFSFGKDVFAVAHMARSLEQFQSFIRSRPGPSELKEFIRKRYWVYRSAGSENSGSVLYTGYYEPLLLGQMEKTDRYPCPIYARPEDMVSIDLSKFSEQFKGKSITGRHTSGTVVPYYDRREIEAGRVLEGKVPVLAWVKDPVDLFFLQIQGSGKVYLDSGKTLNVHYHASNGHPYRSIGKLLIDEGKIPREQMSMQSIRAYLRNHPEELQTILNHNPSYVFFKLEADGPIGYLGVRLTPGRSIAVDRQIFPLAALAFIRTKQPLVDGGGQIHHWTDCTRFALSQDIGGAIRGPGRADLFWGNGPYAEIAAGHMQHRGRLYFLVLKPDTTGS